MEIYQLKYVLTVAKYMNFSRAASEVCVTPSSLSQQIKKLEEELGIVLFGRTTRSVHLTPAGVEFVEYAKKIMQDISGVNHAMQKYVVGESGQISIGGIPALGAFGITPLIASFQKTYPKISLEFHEAECLDLYPLLLHSKVDVAFLTAYDKYKPGKVPIEAYPLVQDEIVIVTSPSHPFAARKTIDLHEAANENFICFSKTSGLYLDTLEACKLSGFEPRFGYDAHSVDTCFGLVAEGMGISMLSSRSAMSTTRKDIAIVRFKPAALRTLSFVFLKKHKLASVLLNLKNFLVHWSHENNFPFIIPAKIPCHELIADRN
ncbi:HTH-type transcriptional regulator GltC [Sporomusa silvacetica DSM 10669]|uniref:HTH-type transcriptional regulator GltC n=1 Tax=Sporomusa silvacetica DSM 10669 TaxID=1123289 RepID=A0ABZ3IJD2_9FIRM|nr:LysR family transcriptional regulator [Sporomusa silvacetica]OZC22241.1 HTH-type transcriptional regulator GltC [Sporomusa silvacetica DSM 10669]